MSHKSEKKNNKNGDKREKVSFAPVNLGKQMITRKGPKMFSMGNGDIRIQHREYFGDLKSNADLTMNKLYSMANPGLATPFPWLAKIASRFETYTFEKLAIDYVPMVGTATPGCVILAADYDASDYLPEDAVTVCSYAGAVRSQLWQPCRFECEPKLLKKFVKERFIRSDDITDDDDLRLYDACTLLFYNYGSGLVSTVPGGLFIDYDVILRTPNMDTSVDSTGSSKIVDDGAGTSKANPFGAMPLVTNASNSAPVIKPISSTQVRFERPGEYSIWTSAVGTGLNAAAPTLTFPSAADGAEVYTWGGVVNAAATSGWYQTIIHVIRPTIVTLVATAAWTTLTAINLRVSAYKNTVL